MRYVTHHFAHLETLSLAHRWLVQLGFDPASIEVHAEGIPRIALAVPGERVAEAEMVINAAELTDPGAWPSFWDLARQDHRPASVFQAEPPPISHVAKTTAIGWHPEAPDDARARSEVFEVSSRFE